MKTEARQPRNRDAGRGGHPTQFAPKTKATSTLSAVDLLSADDINESVDSRGVAELTAYRDSVEAGTVVPPGFNTDVGTGEHFLNSLDKQIAYARRGDTESDAALRFHNLRLGAAERFVVDGKEFVVELGHDGETSLMFETTIAELQSPDVPGMLARDRETYEHEALEHVMESVGGKSVSAKGDTATVRVKARRPQFNSLPDCANKIADVELDSFIAADGFRQDWLRKHVAIDEENWITGPAEHRFVS